MVIDAWEKERSKHGMTLLAACEETIVQVIVPTIHRMNESISKASF